MEIERLEMNVSHQDSTSQSPATINDIEPDREHNQRLCYSMSRHIHSLNESYGYSHLVMEAKKNIVSFHHIETMKVLIKVASTVGLHSNEQNTTIEPALLACDIEIQANADCMVNTSQTLGPTAIDYSKQEAELYLTVDSSVYKINIGSLSPVEKLELEDDISAITFDKELTN